MATSLDKGAGGIEYPAGLSDSMTLFLVAASTALSFGPDAMSRILATGLGLIAVCIPSSRLRWSKRQLAATAIALIPVPGSCILSCELLYCNRRGKSSQPSYLQAMMVALIVAMARPIFLTLGEGSLWKFIQVPAASAGMLQSVTVPAAKQLFAATLLIVMLALNFRQLRRPWETFAAGLGVAILCLLEPVLWILPIAMTLLASVKHEQKNAGRLSLVGGVVVSALALLQSTWMFTGPAPLPRRLVFLSSSMTHVTKDTLTTKKPDYRNLIQRFASRDIPTISVDGFSEVQMHSTDWLFIITPTESLSEQDCQKISGFVSNGGVCIVCADHTNIGGILSPTNSALAGVPISIRNDSAIPDGRWDWTSKLFVNVDCGPDLDSANNGFGTSIGASLDLKPGAVPLLYSDSAFSDSASHSASGLGNTLCDPGEQSNGIVLVAGYKAGNGTYIVFGDTSAFQGANVARNLEHLVQQMRYWAKVKPTWAVLVLPLLLLGVTIATCLIALCPVSRGLIVVVCCIKTIVSLQFGPPAWNAANNAVVFDGARRSTEFSKDSKLMRGELVTLTNNLNLPYQESDSRTLSNSFKGSLIIPSSNIPADKSHYTQWNGILSQGGTLIFLTGARESTGNEPFLRQYDLSVSHTLIGNQPNGDWKYMRLGLDGQGPRFRSAWALHYHSREWKTVSSCWNQPVIAYRRVGDGLLIVIGDSNFVSDANLDSTTSIWNRTFLTLVLSRRFLPGT